MNKGRIYKISDPNEEMVYIGSTISKSLKVRLSRHKYHYKIYKQGRFNYITIFKLFDKYGTDNLKIEILEELEFTLKNELRKKEGYYIQKQKNCVNKLIAGLTNLESVRLYKERNKELISKRRKEQYKKIGYIKRKEYYEKHKNDIKLKYQNNKKKIDDILIITT